MIKVILKRGRDESLKRFHPWVFSGAIAQIQGSPAEGDMVAVYSSEGGVPRSRPLSDRFHRGAHIVFRRRSRSRPDFWVRRLGCAVDVRRSVGLDVSGGSGTNCFRLVHGEGDGLPGLVVDWYDGVCVLQAHSVGMFRAKIPDMRGSARAAR